MLEPELKQKKFKCLEMEPEPEIWIPASPP